MKKNNLKIVALLPMKGISERIPSKNLKSFCSKPLFHVVLNKLISCEFIHEVLINTDCENIKKNISENFKNKVRIIDRPKNLIGNYVSMNEIIKHDISLSDADIYFQTHSTNPLLLSTSIEKSIRTMIDYVHLDKYDSIFSVTETKKRFYTRSCTPMNHDPTMLVTQHLEPIFEENSCFYLFTKSSFLLKDSRIGAKPYMFSLNKIESVDIDNPEDFIIAESLYEIFR